MKVFKGIIMNGTDKTHDYFAYVNYIRVYLSKYDSNISKEILYIISVGN